jgi:hypothetical protein
MEPQNPYQASSNVVEAKRSEPEGSGRWFGWLEIGVAFGLAILMLAGMGHRCQLHDVNAYTTSPLIAIEILGILAVLALIPVLLARFLYCAIRRRFKTAIVTALLAIASVGVIVAMMLIDAPTLMYAT